MPYVNMTRDFNEVRKPIALGLTKRQLLGITIMAAIGIPLYLLLYKKAGLPSDVSIFIMLFAILPVGFCTLYTKDGLFIEKHIRFYYETHRQRATERPYKTQNLYDLLDRQEKLRKEIDAILEKNKIRIPKDGLVDKQTKKEIEKAIEKAKQRGRIPRSAQETIPYDKAYPDGIFEIEPGYYSKTIAFEDINYQLLDKNDKNDRFEHWCDLLNSSSPNVHYEFNYYNQRTNRKEYEEDFRIAGENDKFDAVRREYSGMLLHQLEKGSNDIRTERLLTFCVREKSYKAAKVHLEKIATTLQKNFMRFNCRSRVLDGYERLKIMFLLFHQGTDEKFMWNFDLPVNTGLSSKDFIAPSSFDFKPSDQLDATRYFRSGEDWGAVSYIKIYAADMDDRVIADLLNIHSTMLITIHADVLPQTMAINKAKDELNNVQRMKIKEQKNAVRQGFDMDLLPPDMVDYEKGAVKLVGDLRNSNERLFLATMTIVQLARTKKELDENIFEVNSKLEEYQCSLVRLDNRQEQGFMSALPLGGNMIEIKRMLTTTNKAIFIPFTTETLYTPKGQYYGLNALSNMLITLNRKALVNPNGLVFGKPGYGKTFSVKREMIDVFLRTKDDIMIIDPEGEYRYLTRLLGGQVIELSVGSRYYINPLDIDLEISNEEDEEYDAISAKCSFILSLCDLILSDRGALTKKETSIIDACCRRMYERFARNPVPENMPVMKELQEELMNVTGRGQAIAADLALSLDIFVNGSLSYFNHRTNVKIKKRIVCYDIKKMQKNMWDAVMLVIQDHIWERVAKNRQLAKATWVDIDEYHLLLRKPITAAYCVEMWKRFRKWGGIPTGITQNVKDLFRSPEIQNILDTTDFIMILNQAGDDARILADHLDISRDEMAYIKTGEPGKGLLFAGNTKIPFKDEFPKDTLCYKIMTSKPGEAIV
ncbi:hypothetical protein IMSAG249_00282 [Lachnospiraceae bacterium]|nr:hypothetical protein IMSAG249_00282 [Lachnospiraceae bacterium]